MTPTGGHSDSGELRSKAEKELSRRAVADPDLAKTDLQKLVHELQTHQIELEMQNEELRAAQEERDALIIRLEEALRQVKQLTGILPICASCKKIRDKENCWLPLESYISNHSEAQFTHGVCPDCAKRLYPPSFLNGTK